MSLRTRRRNRIAVIIAFVAILAVLLLWLISCSAVKSVSFAVSGSVTVPLKPGVTSPIDVVIDNVHAEELGVSDLLITVTSVDAPNATKQLPCTVADFAVTQTSQTIVVPAEGSVSLSALGWPETSWPQLSMLDTTSNQDGCVGARLHLDYSAFGEARS